MRVRLTGNTLTSRVRNRSYCDLRRSVRITRLVFCQARSLLNLKWVGVQKMKKTGLCFTSRLERHLCHFFRAKIKIRGFLPLRPACLIACLLAFLLAGVATKSPKVLTMGWRMYIKKRRKTQNDIGTRGQRHENSRLKILWLFFSF